MITLYINTATPQTTLALYEGSDVRAKLSWESQQDESEKLLPNIEKLLEQASLKSSDVKQILLCIGPGGFTSTRVGVSVANAWAFAKQIPIASVPVFDLYSNEADFCFVTANPREGWVQKGEKEPEFTSLDELHFPNSFTFTGLLHKEWISALESCGGSYLSQEEELPSLQGIDFSEEMVKPWYYKQANITMSEKHKGIKA